jgi:CRP/FNR family cyclic AMP-dependent transcriptional regulator
MSSSHLGRFEKMNATDPSVLTRLEEGPWGNIYNFQDIQILAKHMVGYRLPKGGLLFEQGDRASFVCFVLSGSIEVFKEDANGREQSLIEIKAGKSLGEMSLVDKEPRSATCRALKDTEVLILDAEGLALIEDNYPHVALSFVRYLAVSISRRLRRTTGALISVGMDNDPLML